AIERGIHTPRPDDVAWIAAEPEQGVVTLQVAPAHVGEAVRRLVVERHRSVVLTSATLAVAGDLGFTAERLGVEDVAERLRLGSPFDFAAQAQLLLPTDIADPREPDFAADTAALVEEIARAIDGRTLVLFTSHAALRDVASRLAPLEDGGIAVLAQGVDGSRRALLDRYRAGRAVLLGTQSFWEGVDLPGEQLRCVVVARLPFAVPDDPLVAGRAERYDDPFREFHLPQAVLRLRQGFGRLIRRRTDRGSVVLLDRRVLTQQYGSVFLGSLPEATLRRATMDEIPALVASWGVG
ncbi:MAG: ATP-dependent DNA helicase, partial [Candidatus Limnocylindria bacterium]